MRTVLLILTAIICTSAFADSSETLLNVKPSHLKIINVSQLTDQDLNEIMQGHCPEVAIEFSEYSTLPIHFFLKGDLLNLIENQAFGQIEIKQTFYVCCVQNELFLSSNLTDWKPFLEFITGTISISLMHENRHPVIKFGSEANKRI